MVLTLDFNDRTSDLIDEAMDLAIRVSTELAPASWRANSAKGGCLRSPRRGIWPSTAPLSTPMICCTTAAWVTPRRAITGPCCSKSMAKRIRVAPPYVLQANNGDALALAAEQGMGVTTQPDFIVEEALASGTLQPILQDFAPPPFGIYAVLPSNRLLTQRQRW